MGFGWQFIVLHWIFIIGTLLLCAVAAMPTRAWTALGDRLRADGTKRRQARLEAALAAQTTAFTAQESFLPRGVGLALDRARGLVFLAEPDGAQMRAAIIPADKLTGHQVTLQVENGFQQYFLEVFTPGAARPAWRLPCADAGLAAEMDRSLAGL